jgi:hypothetical protein
MSISSDTFIITSDFEPAATEFLPFPAWTIVGGCFQILADGL